MYLILPVLMSYSVRLPVPDSGNSELSHILPKILPCINFTTTQKVIHNSSNVSERLLPSVCLVLRQALDFGLRLSFHDICNVGALV